MTGPDRRKSNLRLALPLAGLVFGMLGFAFASVPLYRIFCQVTGFGGTTQVAAGPADRVLEREVHVRFDANRDPSLPWQFEPVQREVVVQVGEQGLAFYRAVNRGSEPVIGTATFNVTPLKAGQYFNKIECFCFTEQRLDPGQSIDMPVTFFVDPRIAEDRNLDRVRTITLSYTFYRVGDDANGSAVHAAESRPASAVGPKNESTL